MFGVLFQSFIFLICHNLNNIMIKSVIFLIYPNTLTMQKVKHFMIITKL